MQYYDATREITNLNQIPTWIIYSRFKNLTFFRKISEKFKISQLQSILASDLFSQVWHNDELLCVWTLIKSHLLPDFLHKPFVSREFIDLLIILWMLYTLVTSFLGAF